ncbi:hypothetical protein [Streptomyces sp. BE133]|uniref:hypothetical protein n=1 Tax=Streptomyces sp. BE133 TaxID=3002523 RepID=UPI002E79FF96|nr:hypothetical protein [Streptomyces sp. BE133]MEE1806887.1 hypothetical protein [Streptomyces sp. BE133]
MIGISLFHDLLPLPAPAAHAPLHPDEHADIDADWPALPTADFPLFLAICRRRLAGDTFDQLNLTYRAEAQRTDEFVRRHRHDLTPSRTPGEFQRQLNAYLRDERLGTAASPRLALLTRAIQAALLTRGVLLRWQSAALGPAAPDKLTTWLTPGICRALRGAVTSAHHGLTTGPDRKPTMP